MCDGRSAADHLDGQDNPLDPTTLTPSLDISPFFRPHPMSLYSLYVSSGILLPISLASLFPFVIHST